MPYTFVEIEEHKTRNIVLLFSSLVVLYVVSLLVLVGGVRWMTDLKPLPVRVLVNVLTVACALAGFHWLVSTGRLVERVLLALQAHPLDPQDSYHQRLSRIVEEVTVATGGRRRIEPLVIATPAMNACAVAEFSGRSAIVVTEGLLARLSRPQLEAVIGHEAAHIVSGDSLGRSVFCGLFALHEEALKHLSKYFSDDGPSLRGRGALYILFVMAVLWLTTKAKRLCELTISRQQEYRADATAVRLTRDPVSLAEALHIISRRWRGVGDHGESLSTIFFLDTGSEPLSEQQGLWAEMFSTHPPASRRIAVLLDMARLRLEDFDRAIERRPQPAKQLRPVRPAVESEPVQPTMPRWLIWLQGAWQGPFVAEDLARLAGATPESWVRREDGAPVMPAHQDPGLVDAFRRRFGAPANQARWSCPRCRISLARRSYEGVQLQECPACAGCYMTPDQISRIFSREEYAFSEDVHRLARTIPAVKHPGRVARRFGSLPYNRLEHQPCPACGSAVVRKFYTEAYLVEVEQCWMCGLTWLDHPELELLQCLYEETQG